MKIAVLDHELAQAEAICQALSGLGHACHSCLNGKQLLAQLDKERYDMLLFDWQSSDFAGAEMVLRARAKLAPNAPVMFLTDARDDNDIDAGLRAAADDYLIKPLRRKDIVVRVQAQLRRAFPLQSSVEQFHFEQYAFDLRLARLRIDGSLLELTQKEFQLALLFFRNIGRPLSRAYIHDAVWSSASDMPSRTLDTHVARVRNKLQLTQEHGFRLMPVYSYGYRLERASPGAALSAEVENAALPDDGRTGL